MKGIIFPSSLEWAGGWSRNQIYNDREKEKTWIIEFSGTQNKVKPISMTQQTQGNFFFRSVKKLASTFVCHEHHAVPAHHFVHL